MIWTNQSRRISWQLMFIKFLFCNDERFHWTLTKQYGNIVNNRFIYEMSTTKKENISVEKKICLLETLKWQKDQQIRASFMRDANHCWRSLIFEKTNLLFNWNIFFFFFTFHWWIDFFFVRVKKIWHGNVVNNYRLNASDCETEDRWECSIDRFFLSDGKLFYVKSRNWEWIRQVEMFRGEVSIWQWSNSLRMFPNL